MRAILTTREDEWCAIATMNAYDATDQDDMISSLNFGLRATFEYCGTSFENRTTVDPKFEFQAFELVKLGRREVT
jgi:hypothetical protein